MAAVMAAAAIEAAPLGIAAPSSHPVPTHPFADHMTEPTPQDPHTDTLIALEDLLDDIRLRLPDTPQWEFCDGMLAALLCTRREVPADEWLPLVFQAPADEVFESEAQRQQFFSHWQARQAHVQASLQASVESLDDQDALQPALLDWRGLVNELSAEERADMQAHTGHSGNSQDMPALAQLWAMGFMCVVEALEDDWQPPRDKEIAQHMHDALDCVNALTDDVDTTPPTIVMSEAPGALPSVTEARFEALGEAIWAVYDLYAIAQSLGPRTAPARRAHSAGRNDPCPCGSGQKYKKCCGA